MLTIALTGCLQIKCNRTRPTCEACQVFAVPCIYGMLHLPKGACSQMLTPRQMQCQRREDPKLMFSRPCSSVLTAWKNASTQKERATNWLRSSPLRYTMLPTAPRPIRPRQIHNNLLTVHKITAVLVLAIS